MKSLQDYFLIASEINENVSNFLISSFGTLKTMSHKKDSHWGIEDDIKANRMYEEFLKVRTPEVSLFTEEGERNLNSSLVWVIDPIEGTSNYRARNPFWATQIALIKDGTPVLSIVNAPNLKMKFSAIKGKGAQLNGSTIGVSKLKELNQALVDFGRGTEDSDKDWLINCMKKVLKRIRTNRSFGACGLCCSFCAAGITDIYINFGSQVYDLVPGSLIIREAGGEALNFDGNDWSINDKSFLASNNILTREVLKIIV